MKKRIISDVDIIETFEDTIAEYAWSKYGISISSATNALFLSLLYLKEIGKLKDGDTIKLPSKT